LIRLTHGRCQLALHERHRGAGTPLLLLHALRGSSEDWSPDVVESWSGPVLALDFAGHGRSDWHRGGVYTPELFAADADAAAAHIGPCRVAGAGLGAYVALLLAGARPDAVCAALLLPGAGLAGGGALPDFGAEGQRIARTRREELALAEQVEPPGAGEAARVDPFVQWCDGDVRPVDYAETFAASARRILLAEDGDPRPPWWEAVRRLASARRVDADLRTALGQLAS
jgi:pimeloyl-ACP methyl ester carboxylesterase